MTVKDIKKLMQDKEIEFYSNQISLLRSERIKYFKNSIEQNIMNLKNILNVKN